MKHLLMLLALLLVVRTAPAQAYKYIEEGLSSKRVYAIQKDGRGYMWFMTHAGMDRYDGNDFRHYRLHQQLSEEQLTSDLCYLFTDSQKEIWVVGRQGDIFCYDPYADRFQWVYQVVRESGSRTPNPISCCFMDDEDNLWMSNQTDIFIYHTRLQSCTQLAHDIGQSLTCMEQIDHERFFVGTADGIHYACLEKGELQLSPCLKLDTLQVAINEIYLHRPTRQAFMGTCQQGVVVYDLNLHCAHHLRDVLTDIQINRICPLDSKHILLATEGAGVYRMNTTDFRCEPYIMADHTEPNGMNGNDIKDLYIDEEQRIWMAVYPLGITVRDDRYPAYRWMKHAIGNGQSLVNDQVNAVLEDSEGDIWLATNNGISLYDERRRRWNSLLSSFDEVNQSSNHIFFTLCEVAPGIIWTGGYHSGIYQIEKRTGRVQLIMPSQFSSLSLKSDKYIRVLMKDRRGLVWAGSNYNLKSIDLARQASRLYEGVSGVTDLVECDDRHLWVGTTNGLYLLDKQSGETAPVALPDESYTVHCLCWHSDGRLYIGTNQSGIYVYHPPTKQFVHYHAENSALLSNNICSILSDGKGGLLFGTEKGVAYLPSGGERFYNWTRMQGLQTDHFNVTSGCVRRNGHFILGSVEGAVEFGIGMFRPSVTSCRLLLTDLQIEGENRAEADQMIRLEQTGRIELTHGQHSLSLRATAINYSYTPEFLYSWRLEGESEWSHPKADGTIRLRQLSAGSHRLQVRAVSNEERQLVLDEREVIIEVSHRSWVGVTGWVVAVASTGAVLLLARRLRRRRQAPSVLPAEPEENSQPEERATPDDADLRFMGEVHRAVMAHIEQTDYNIDDLCGQLHMSRTSFYHRMKSLTGMPPADYVRQLRLQHAAQLLTSRQYTISEVADRSGFNDAKYFREVFKKYYGVSPSHYAKGEGELQAKKKREKP